MSQTFGNSLISQIKNTNRLVRRFIALWGGVAVMSIAIGLLRSSLFGNDPYSCMTIGFSNATGLSFGVMMTIINIVLFIPMVIWGRSYIKIGILVYLLFLGPMSDICYGITQAILGSPDTYSLGTRIALLVSGVFISSYGTSLYTCSNAGLGPYDAIGWMLQHASGEKIAFRWIRIVLDCISSGLGLYFGSIVSLGTITLAFFTGPLVSFYNKINLRIIYGDNPPVI